MFPGSPVTSDHHHLGLFGQVDECWYGPPKEQFAVGIRSIAALCAVLGDLDRIGDDPAGFVLLNYFENLLRDSAGRPRQRRRRDR